MTEQREALLPCPFCGGEAVIDTGLMVFCDAEVHCRKCCISTANFDSYGDDRKNGNAIERNRIDAIKAWNTRATTSQAQEIAALRAEIERLREALDYYNSCRVEGVDGIPDHWLLSSTHSPSLFLALSKGREALAATESRGK